MGEAKNSFMCLIKLAHFPGSLVLPAPSSSVGPQSVGLWLFSASETLGVGARGRRLITGSSGGNRVSHRRYSGRRSKVPSETSTERKRERSSRACACVRVKGIRDR